MVFRSLKAKCDLTEFDGKVHTSTSCPGEIATIENDACRDTYGDAETHAQGSCKQGEQSQAELNIVELRFV